MRAELELGARQPDGATMKEHLESVRRQTGVTPERLQAALDNPCPEPLRYLWDLWRAASARRRFQEGVPQALSNSELRDFLELRGVRLVLFEVLVLDHLEQVYLRHCAGVKPNG